MTAAVLEVGDNLLQVALAVVTLGTLVVNTLMSRRAAGAAESTAKELQNNGGGSALDKIEAGQREVVAGLDAVSDRLDQHDQRLARIERNQ